MDSAQWTQEFGLTASMAELASPLGTACARPALMEKKIMRPPKDQVLNCPRCHSTNTKFCYYNNYSLTQPRYFCKTCRRYWTEGGTLRNIPVGGGSRKHKKPASTPNGLPSAADQTPFSSQKLALGPDLNPPSIPHFPTHHQNPKILDQGQDLNLGFQGPHDYSHGLSRFLEFPRIEDKDVISPSSSSSALSFMKNGNGPARGMNSFFHNVAPGGALDQTTGNNLLFGPGFLFQECKPSLGFSIDGVVNGSGYSSSKAPVEENANGTLMFPLGQNKRDSSTSEGGDQNQDKGTNENNSNGFWNGMLGGGSW